VGDRAHLNDVTTLSVPALPEGVVTFLFTDIEGSTKLLRDAGTAYADLLGSHHRLLRRSASEHGGHEVDTQGDAFFFAFSSPRAAVDAASAGQRALETHPWPDGRRIRVRMGLHVGEPVLVDGHYIGLDVHRAARICNAAHGGQVVVSARLYDALGERGLAGLAFTDLGEHRLKDLPEPQRLLQLQVPGLPERFPPIRSMQPPTNLPHRVRALVGRSREVEELRSLLTASGTRLVTITGPGGTGKTRLAVATAHGLLETFAHGTFFVDLTPVRDSDRIISAIAQQLGLLVEGGQPAVELVAGHIVDRHLLLVLDNFEHVVDGAAVLSQLVQACPGLHVFVTSRRLLWLEDEQEYPLEPLLLPRGSTLDEVRDSEAGILFEQRARLARPGFALTEVNAAAVAELCRMLDGLPLAIELAAARTRLLSPHVLVERLGHRLELISGDTRDLPERQRSLRSTIEWSYDLLSSAEREHFRDLAVFSGGARLDAIGAVSAGGSDELALVTTLVDHSLVRMREDADGEPRFTMLETLREYAEERLLEDPAHAHDRRQRHARHYLRVALDVRRAALEGATDYSPTARDEDNIRGALTFLLRRGGDDPDAAADGLLLASAMGSYWYQHTGAVEGTVWLERALDAVPDPPAEVEADARRWLGVLAEQQQDFVGARQLLEQAKDLYERAGNRSRVAACLNSLGVVSRSEGDVARAEELLLAAVQIRREQGEDTALTSSLNNLGIIYLDRGDHERAQQIFTENLARDRASQDLWGATCTSLNLAVAHLIAGDADAAQPLLRACLTAYDDLGDLDVQIGALEATAGLAAARGQWRVGARLAAATTQARASHGVPAAAVDLVHLERWAAQCEAQLSADEVEAAQNEGIAMTVDQATGHALTQVAKA
jgi:predicted ATPase/class 3 adenylate cyclase